MTTYNDVTAALPALAKMVLGGDELESRAGRVKEVLHNHIELLEPWKREVTLPGRKASLPAQIAETMWVLSGRNDVEWLSAYLPRAAEFSDDGEVWRGGYGPRIRNWGGVDQLAHVLDLLRADPTSRRAVIAIYDPAVDTEPGKDIPCNDLLVFSSRLGRLDLSVHVRSNDLWWGWSGINQFEWSALQEIVAGMLGLNVGSLHFHTVSLHLYDHHWAKASTLQAPWFVQQDDDTPRFRCVGNLEDLDEVISQWFELESKARLGTLTEQDITEFPEPMLRSWLRVIGTWWAGGSFMGPLKGTRLAQALALTPQGGRPKQAVPAVDQDEALFIRQTAKLHAEKSAAYGDSWKRRGEMLGIMANIARKVDRLGVSDTNETSADTAQDLLVYLVKYLRWLNDSDAGFTEDKWVEGKLKQLGIKHFKPLVDVTGAERALTVMFNSLEHAVMTQPGARTGIVDEMTAEAYRLAFALWRRNNHHNPYRNVSTADV
jgi:thymidylate synthase